MKKPVRKSAILVFAFLFLTFSCSQNEPNKIKQKVFNKRRVSQTESFDVFFKKFLVDSLFQFSRTEFPLKEVEKSDEGEKVVMQIREKWKYSNFKNIKNLLVDKPQVNGKIVSVLLRIEDTGVHVTYFFRNRNGRWLLCTIIDESD